MKKLLYLFFFWLIVSCEKEQTKPPITVDSLILIEVEDIMTNSEKKIILNCQTEKIYNCSNYYIDQTQIIADDKFSFIFNGIGTDKICTTALEPAKTTLYIGALASGAYPLSLKVNGLQNTGTLTVTDTKILLDFPQQNGLKILNPVYDR